jgi:pilus assembly protein FimV
LGLLALFSVLTLGITVTDAHAASLGRLNVESALGQPLRAEVDVSSVGQDEAPTLQVRLAPRSVFRQANLEFNPTLTQLRFDLEARDDGSYVVHVTSAQPINEPLDLVLELTWSTGSILREYTVVPAPPALKGAPEIVSPVAAPPEARRGAPGSDRPERGLQRVPKPHRTASRSRTGADPYCAEGSGPG